MTVSRPTLRRLERAGWFEGRAVDTAEAVEHLESEGHTPSPAALAFLREFGDLWMDHLVSHLREGTAGLDLDPFRATGGLGFGRLARWEARASEGLCPVGSAFDGLLTLLVGASGRVYGLFDDDRFVLVGEDGRSALDNLSLGMELPDHRP